MSAGRLTASVEASGLIRRAQTAGDFAAVVRKGDPDRGALLIVVRSRGEHVTCLERSLSMDGRYVWAAAGPLESAQEGELADFLKKRIAFDQDLWVIELDIADPERFIAETTSAA
jgi:hypothetical protein